MPQGRDELRKFWEGCANAWEHLRPNFTSEKFIIRAKDSTRKPTFVDYQAIEYLVDEWDWGYDAPMQPGAAALPHPSELDE